jgi:hypothetical protein
MVAYLATKREELESALAAAEAAREQLEAALVKAEAALINTVTDASKIDANRADANAKVDQARARCRQLRAALIEPGHSEFATRSRKRMDTPVRQSEELSKRKATGSLPSIQPSEQAVLGTSNRSQDEPRQRKPSHRSDVSASAQEPGPKDARARPDLLRQTIGFLALTLAYLAYFHVDVQLKIVNLPSIFP